MALLPTTKTPRTLDPQNLISLIYGRSKIGKTTFAAGGNDTLFLATEAGLNSLEAYQIRINSWAEFLAALNEIAHAEHPFRTIVVDTIDLLYRHCTEYILKKFNIQHESDLGYGKGYALINNEFQRVLTKQANLPFGLMMISHAREIEIDTRTGKSVRVVPALPDKARQIVVGMCDLILYCDVESVPAPAGQNQLRRVIRTKPTPFYEAGDRTGRLPETLELDYGKFRDAFEQATK